MHPGAMKVWRMLLPIGLGVSLPNIDQMVNKAFASYLGPGDTTAIMNAYRLMLLPIGVFAQAMALAVFPPCPGRRPTITTRPCAETMNQSLRNILFLTVPASALMFLLAEPVITFLLQSGKYTACRYARDGVRPALSQPGHLRLVLPVSADTRLLRPAKLENPGDLRRHRQRLVRRHELGRRPPHHWGVAGLGLATSLAAAIHMTALFFLLRGRLRGLQGTRLLVSISKTIIATLALCLAAQFVRALSSLSSLPAPCRPNSLPSSSLPSPAASASPPISSPPAS